MFYKQFSRITDVLGEEIAEQIDERSSVMRSTDRFDKLYDNIKEIHRTYFPRQRFGQFCSNFFGWLASVKKIDLFFPEDDKMIELLKEYVEDQPQFFHHSWELEGVEL